MYERLKVVSHKKIAEKILATSISQGDIFRYTNHYNDAIWTSCSLKSPDIRLFVWQLMRTHIKETSKSALLALCEGKSPVIGEFPAQRDSNAEKAPISDHDHENMWLIKYTQ